MKAAKSASGWYCQSPPDVHTHIYTPHILAPSTRSVELSLYFRCIGTTLVWPLSVYLHAHRLTDDPSHQLIVRFHPLAKPCEFTILPLSCPLTHTPSLFLAFLRMQTHEHTLFLPLTPPPPPPLVFLGSYCSLWCNCASAPCCFPTVAPHWRPPLYPGELSLTGPTLNAGYYTT